ncbi:hypothetical protein D3C76_1270730 [compost metagenome]
MVVDDTGAASFPVSFGRDSDLAQAASALYQVSSLRVRHELLLEFLVRLIIDQFVDLASEDRRFNENHPDLSYVIGVVEW